MSLTSAPSNYRGQEINSCASQTPGRKDVSLSSGSYTYTDEESEGAPKGECPATKTPPSRTGQHRQQSLQSLLQNFQRKFQSLLLQWPWKTTLGHLHLSGMAMQWLAAPATTIVTSVCAAAADPAIAVTDAEAQEEGEHTGTSCKATKEATGTTVRAQDAGPAVAARAESQSRENPQARTRSAATRSSARRRSTQMVWCANIVGKSCRVWMRCGNTRVALKLGICLISAIARKVIRRMEGQCGRCSELRSQRSRDQADQPPVLKGAPKCTKRDQQNSRKSSNCEPNPWWLQGFCHCFGKNQTNHLKSSWSFRKGNQKMTGSASKHPWISWMERIYFTSYIELLESTRASGFHWFPLVSIGFL